MSSAGWTGSRFVEGNSWPQDYIESCSTNFGTGGSDIADMSTLAVYAGHGNQNLLAFGTPHSGRCDVTFTQNMRLGSANNARAGYGMWLVSHSMADIVTSVNSQWSRQHFGFINSPWIEDNAPWLFFEGTQNETNASAWISVMNYGGDSPIVATYSTSINACWSLHDSAKLKANVSVSPRAGGAGCLQGQPAFSYCWEWF